MTLMHEARIDFYIYYRVSEDADFAEAHARVVAMQSELAWRCGVHAQLVRRADDATTWMEVYRGVAGRIAPDFEAELEAAWARHQLARILAPGASRHIERFIPCV